jgi:hypothetical protein
MSLESAVFTIRKAAETYRTNNDPSVKEAWFHEAINTTLKLLSPPRVSKEVATVDSTQHIDDWIDIAICFAALFHSWPEWACRGNPLQPTKELRKEVHRKILLSSPVDRDEDTLVQCMYIDIHYLMDDSTLIPFIQCFLTSCQNHIFKY